MTLIKSKVKIRGRKLINMAFQINKVNKELMSNTKRLEGIKIKIKTKMTSKFIRR